MEFLFDQLTSQLQGDAFKQIGQVLGSDDKKTGQVTNAAIATLLGGLAKNTTETSGAQSLLSALTKDHDGSILNQAGNLMNASQGGAGILKHILGAKEQGVTQGLSKSTGLQPEKIAQVLSMLAPLVMGGLGQMMRQGDMQASTLSKSLQNEVTNLKKNIPQSQNLLTSLLDTDGDGDLDLGDFASHGMGMLGKFLNR